MLSNRKYTNEAWKSPEEDVITIFTDKNGYIKKIMAKSVGIGPSSGEGYLWYHLWDGAQKQLADVLDTFPQLWIYELRTHMVKV